VINIGAIWSVPNSNPLGGQKSLVVAVDNLKWDAYLYLYSLFTDIYNPNKISIDVLTLDLNAIQSNIEFGANQVQTLAALPNSEIFEFLKVLDIKKMFVKGEQNIEIAPILITANNKQLTLKITGQSLNLGVLEHCPPLGW
jgi:hypothetical protein